MIDLLKQFTVEQIIIFVFTLALAIKGIIDFWDWITKKNKAKFDKDYQKIKDNDAIVKEQEELEEHYKDISDKYNVLDEKINSFSTEVMNNLKVINKSMMHDIKQWIIEQHRAYMKQGWIDITDLNMLEYRYADYEALGGNSSIPTLMDELRALPKYPPKSKI